MGRSIVPVLIAGALSCTGAAYAEFVADDFNGASLSPQWTFHDSDPAGSVIGHTDPPLY